MIGGNEEAQLSIYDTSLPVLRYKTRIYHNDLLAGAELFEVDPYDIDAVLEVISDWTGSDTGVDEEGFFAWSTSNPRGRWNWWILGGRWAGSLKLLPGASGELGTRGAGHKEIPLPFNELSADRALLGDVDWRGMKRRQEDIAARLWDGFVGSPHSKSLLLGVEDHVDRDSYIALRSHPATFAVVKNCDWFERYEVGWWGVCLDARPVQEWHDEFDSLLADLPPDTLISVVDCHS